MENPSFRTPFPPNRIPTLRIRRSSPKSNRHPHQIPRLSRTQRPNQTPRHPPKRHRRRPPSMLATRRSPTRLDRLPESLRRVRSLRQRPSSSLPRRPSSRRTLLPRHPRRRKRSSLRQHANRTQEFRNQNEGRQIPPIVSGNRCSGRCCGPSCT
jgi:hypothetical protein